jgi:methyl-accepting chemotaxis protein
MNDILRNSDSTELYQKLISAIVKYLNVVQGGIYIEREDEQGETYLNLEACYAFDRIKFINRRIEIGQGLVGECYLEKENIILKQVPEDYVHITSGLGDAPPNFVSIIPIKSEDDLKGILELASFKTLEDHEIQFLERLGEVLTVFITNHVINERTKQLLEHSQMQTEQLRAQEEEMRQNMEEMQATQEEMQRKEREYIERIDTLEKSLAGATE